MERKFLCALVCAVVIITSGAYAADNAAIRANLKQALEQVINQIAGLEVQRERIIGQILMLNKLDEIDKEECEDCEKVVPADPKPEGPAPKPEVENGRTGN